MSQEPLNKDKKSVLSEPVSFDEQVSMLFKGKATRVRIDPFYFATAAGRWIHVHSTAPGALDNESLGVFRASLPQLARFFMAAYEATASPEKQIMESNGKTDEFLNELKELAEEASKNPQGVSPSKHGRANSKAKKTRS